jgi:hypothetical protein
MQEPNVTAPIVFGVVFTFLIHGGVLGGCAIMQHFDGLHADRRASTLEQEKVTTIEAGLAIKKKSASGKKSKLPQKDVAAKVKPPDAPGVAMDPNATPSSTKKKDNEYIPPDKQDPNSVFDKFRNVDTGEAGAIAEAGGDNENVQGAEDGSEFGILDKAKGDPYVGELIGRVMKDFTVPSVVTEEGLETWGCVRLKEDGKIDEWKIDPDHKSKSHAFNSAVEDKLKNTTDMEQPVPDHLKSLLVEQFACVRFKY